MKPRYAIATPPRLGPRKLPSANAEVHKPDMALVLHGADNAPSACGREGGGRTPIIMEPIN